MSLLLCLIAASKHECVASSSINLRNSKGRSMALI